MDLELFISYCMSVKGVTQDFPFDETTLVFRVANKIFALTDIKTFPFRFSLKCNPERAVELRESYSCIIPGYHLNHKHWNTIEPDSSISSELLKELILHSYQLVFNNLSKKEKESISNL